MPSRKTAIGIDIGGTNMRAARISSTGEILQKQAVAGSRDPERSLELIKDLIVAMDVDDVAAIGIGVPGRVDGRTGQVISGGYLDLSGVDLKGAIARLFDRPVIVANDCSMALIGEARRGSAAGMRNVVMLTIGTGIGGAAIHDGEIVNGRRCAGQFGHLVVNTTGLPCLCGQRGCIETTSSGTALRRHLKEAGLPEDTRFEALFGQALAGDRQALGVLHEWAGPLKAAVGTLSAAFDPDVVLLGGGMGGPAFQALGLLPPQRSWYDVEVRAASLADDAGIIGAGLAALDLVEADPPASARAKRLVMVNGVPASGKSALSHELSRRTGWPVLALDTIKDPFLELIEGVDRPFNKLLGKASYKAIFSVIADAPPGSTFLVDAWFGFQPMELLCDHLSMAGISQVAEVWCHAPPEVVGERYSKRVAQRPAGHPGLAYVPELVALAQRAEPCRLGDVLPVDTTQPRDLDQILLWITKSLAASDVSTARART